MNTLQVERLSTTGQQGEIKSAQNYWQYRRKLGISRSSYYYQETAMRAADKYRKIYTLLKRDGITLSEKVVAVSRKKKVWL